MPSIGAAFNWIGNFKNINCNMNVSRNQDAKAFLPDLIMVYIPNTITVLVIFAYTIGIIRFSKKAYPPESAKRVYSQIIWYPIVTLGVVFMTYVADIVQDVSGCDGFVLSILESPIRNIQGMLYACIYGFHPSLRKTIVQEYEQRRGAKGVEELVHQMEISSVKE